MADPATVANDLRAVEPLAVDSRSAAAIFSLGRSTWFKLVASGRVPRARRLGRRVLYDLAELKEWWAAGAPTRDAWEALRSAHSDKGSGRAGGRKP